MNHLEVKTSQLCCIDFVGYIFQVWKLPLLACSGLAMFGRSVQHWEMAYKGYLSQDFLKRLALNKENTLFSIYLNVMYLHSATMKR